MGCQASGDCNARRSRDLARARAGGGGPGGGGVSVGEGESVGGGRRRLPRRSCLDFPALFPWWVAPSPD